MYDMKFARFRATRDNWQTTGYITWRGRKSLQIVRERDDDDESLESLDSLER